MNIIEFSEGLQAKMKQELDDLNADQDEIIKLGKTLTSIRNLISELKAFTRSYIFQSQAEEVQFFKEVKPVFLSQYFHYKKVFAIRLFDPSRVLNAGKKITIHYSSSLKSMRRRILSFASTACLEIRLLDGRYFYP